MSDTLADVKESFYKFYNGKNMELEKYHELFQAQVEVLKEVGITIEDDSLANSIAQENSRVIPMQTIRSQEEIKILYCVSYAGPTHTIKVIYDI